MRFGGSIFNGNATGPDGNGTNATLALFPILANYLWNFGNHHIEIGAGPELGYVSESGQGVKAVGIFTTARVGYLYAEPGGGFNFSVAYTPIWSDVFSHSFGIGIGYGF